MSTIEAKTEDKDEIKEKDNKKNYKAGETDESKKHTKCKCDSKYKRNYYRYYDTPDGCDIDKKVLVTTRYGIIGGLVAGTYDVLMYSHAVGLAKILERYARHIVPLGLMGATFALVTNGMLLYRHADDGLNYFVGGFSCGPLLAMYLRSKHAVIAGGLALGAIGYIKKDAVDHCFAFFPKIPDHLNTVNDWRKDYTLATDPRDLAQHTCGRKDNK